MSDLRELDEKMDKFSRNMAARHPMSMAIVLEVDEKRLMGQEFSKFKLNI